MIIRKGIKGPWEIKEVSKRKKYCIRKSYFKQGKVNNKEMMKIKKEKNHMYLDHCRDRVLLFQIFLK